MWSQMKGPTKVPLKKITGIIYGGSSSTFKMRSKQIIGKLKMRRHYCKHMDSHFTDKQEIFQHIDGAAVENDHIDCEEVNEEERSSGFFYAWECITLIKQCGATLDLVITSDSNLMALIHVIHSNIDRSSDINFPHSYKILRFKLKLAYECWIQRITHHELIWRAIHKTLVQ